MRQLYALSIAFLVSATLAVYVKYSDEMNIKSTHSEWAEITKIEQKERNFPRVGMDGTYAYWLITVRLADGSTPIIRVMNNSNLKTHSCLPVIVSLFYSNDTIASIDRKKLLSFGLKQTPCGEQ